MTAGDQVRDERHELLLTFDDGPHPEYTPRILDALARRNIKAIFFVIGRRVAAPGGRSLLRRMVEEGHRIGNHSYSHPDLRTLPLSRARDELRRTGDLIAEYAGAARLFRPPYGGTNPSIERVMRQMGYQTMLWNVESEDWRTDRRPTDWICHSLHLIQDRRRSVFLGHDDRPETAIHFDRFLEKTRGIPGCTFVPAE